MIVLKCHCISFITPLPPPTPNPSQKKNNMLLLALLCPPPKDIELWPFPKLPCHHSRHSAHLLSSPWYYPDLGVGSAHFLASETITLQNYKRCIFFGWRETVRCIWKYHKTTSVPIMREEKCYKRRTVDCWFLSQKGGHFSRMACLPNTCANEVTAPNKCTTSRSGTQCKPRSWWPPFQYSWHAAGIASHWRLGSRDKSQASDKIYL